MVEQLVVPRGMPGLFHNLDLDNPSAASPQCRAALRRTHAGGGSDCFSSSGAKTGREKAAEERSVFGGSAETEPYRQFRLGSFERGNLLVGRDVFDIWVRGYRQNYD